MIILSCLYRIFKALLCAVCAVYLVSSAALAEMAASEMQAAMDQGRCPSDLAQVSFLDYKSSCGAEPSGASRGYLDCQNRIDRENNIISSYNEFVQKCAAARVDRSTPNNDLSRRLNSQQSITKQSEQHGTKERYQQQIQQEENQEAKKKQDDQLAEQRRKYEEDLARQQAAQAAERAKVDAERRQSAISSAPPPAPRLVLRRESGIRGQYYHLKIALRNSKAECRKQDGLNVCSIDRIRDDDLSDYSGECVDVRDMYRLVCYRNNNFTDAGRDSWANYDFCVDAVCFP